MTCKHDAPCKNVEAKVFGDWHSLQDPVGRVFDNEYSEVNASGEPSKLSCVNFASCRLLYTLELTVCFE